MRACRLLGHRPHFRAEGTTLIWACARGCGAGGIREYATPEDAARYARALDREDTRDLGRRAPLSLLPLRLARSAGRRRPRSAASGPRRDDGDAGPRRPG